VRASRVVSEVSQNLLAQRWDYIFFLLEVLLWAKLLQKLQQTPYSYIRIQGKVRALLTTS
jgi:hypothetical protein